ncbi:Disease resistance protein (TIR-NBS-LRR class) [Quillaja saponaria]|uniref:Disease resistance protein (TIR-NBS-LRR class) n=1 Tax=Quillaja saponaria TaxID=32244 RepID=A0AAD7LQM2_QUISA|nr:Disease resistance protein (TIR-NBS-LRR class) [Quillaja saponaria]
MSSNIMEKLDLSRTAIEEISPSIGRLHTLVQLDLSFCSKISEIPNEVMACLVSLECLTLTSTSIQGIPASIKNLSRLSFLNIEKCRWLKSLPQLPPSLVRLLTANCTALETTTSSTPGFSQDSIVRPTLDKSDVKLKENEIYVGFENCTRLDQEARNHIVAYAKLIIERVAYLSSWPEPEAETPNDLLPSACICLPGTEIPEWFSYRTTGSSSITIQLPPAEWVTLLNNPKFLGFAFCSVISRSSDKWNPLYEVYFGGKLVHSETCPTLRKFTEFDHVMMIYNSFLSNLLIEKWKDLFNQCNSNHCPVMEIEFRMENVTIKKFGVRIVY